MVSHPNIVQAQFRLTLVFKWQQEYPAWQGDWLSGVETCKPQVALHCTLKIQLMSKCTLNAIPNIYKAVTGKAW